MRRQSIASLCAAGLMLMSVWAAAEDNPGASASPKTAAHATHHRHATKTPNTASGAGDKTEASAGTGLVKQAVKTGGALNDNGMKVLPP